MVVSDGYFDRVSVLLLDPEPTSENSIGEGEGGFSRTKQKTKEALWSCNICHARFPDCDELSTHSSVLHGESYPAECRLCFRRFVSDAELGNHIRIKHIHGLTTISSPSSSSSEATEQEQSWRSSSSSVILTSNPEHAGATNNHKHRRRAGRHKKVRQAETTDTVGTTFISTTHDGSVGQPPPPKKVKSSTTDNSSKENEGKRHWCKICSLDFHSYDNWREHAVFKHIFTKNPYPIVEMNYVDVQSLGERTKDTAKDDQDEDNKEQQESSVTTNTTSALPAERDNNNSSKENSNTATTTTLGKETIRMTICKNKGRNYIVKKSSVSSTDNETADESNSSVGGLPSSPALFQHHTKESDEILIPVALEISQDSDAFYCSSPSSSSNLDVRTGGTGRTFMLERRRRRTSRRLSSTGQKSDSSTGQKSDISSVGERGDKENMPSDIEHDEEVERREEHQQVVAPVAAIRKATERYPGITIEPVIRKVPSTADRALYLGTGPDPHSDQGPVNSPPDSSTMVIVQNDTVQSAEDAMEDLEQLANNPRPYDLSSSSGIEPVGKKSSSSVVVENKTHRMLLELHNEHDEPVDHETSLPQYEVINIPHLFIHWPVRIYA